MTPETIILHSNLPKIPWMDPAVWRLPGTQPIENWLRRDETFAAQMALRDHLIDTVPDKVHTLLDDATDAAKECLELTLSALTHDPEYHFRGNKVTRPDNVEVEIDRHAPLMTLGRLVQNDFCLMQPGENGHRLTGAILCFPGSWTLAEKIGKPLMAIHSPVTEYDEALGRRVQRMFNAMKPDKILWRANAIRHEDPSLFHARKETDPVSVRRGSAEGNYIRSEHQTLRKLPITGAVVFTIHTYVLRISDLPPDAQAAIADAKIKSG